MPLYHEGTMELMELRKKFGSINYFHELVHHYQKNSGKIIDLDEQTL